MICSRVISRNFGPVVYVVDPGGLLVGVLHLVDGVIRIAVLICFLRGNVEDWLVVWNMNFIFPYIGNVIIPTDELHRFSEA